MRKKDDVDSGDEYCLSDCLLTIIRNSGQIIMKLLKTNNIVFST